MKEEPVGRFRVVVFDWDGTAVTSGREDTNRLRDALERFPVRGGRAVVVSGTSFTTVDRQLSARLHGPHKRRVFTCVDRGSKVFGFDRRGSPLLLHRRTASAEEERLLDESPTLEDYADDVLAVLDARAVGIWSP